jgi:hypothetical protein
MNILEENEENQDFTFTDLCNLLKCTCMEHADHAATAITALEIVKNQLVNDILAVNHDNLG